MSREFGIFFYYIIILYTLFGTGYAWCQQLPANFKNTSNIIFCLLTDATWPSIYHLCWIRTMRNLGKYHVSPVNSTHFTNCVKNRWLKKCIKMCVYVIYCLVLNFGTQSLVGSIFDMTLLHFAFEAGAAGFGNTQVAAKVE